MQAHGILDVRHSLFVRLALAVTPLKRGAGDEVAIRVTLQDQRKRQSLHGASIFLS